MDLFVQPMPPPATPSQPYNPANKAWIEYETRSGSKEKLLLSLISPNNLEQTGILPGRHRMTICRHQPTGHEFVVRCIERNTHDMRRIKRNYDVILQTNRRSEQEPETSQLRTQKMLAMLYATLSPTPNEMLMVFEKMDLSLKILNHHHLMKGIVCPEPVVGRISSDVIKGLNFLNKQNIIYRKVKPSNILLNLDGRVKLSMSSMSSGYLYEKHAYTNPSNSNDLSRREYIAPERLDQQPYTTKADIWSLGLVMYESVTGIYHYEPYDTKQKLLYKIYTMPAPQLDQDNGHFSQEIRQFLTGCLNKNVQQRCEYAALAEMNFIKQYSKLDISTYLQLFMQQLNQ